MVGYPYPVKSAILRGVYGRPRQVFSPANWICWIMAGGDAPWTQVASLPLWIAAGLPAYPEDHKSWSYHLGRIWEAFCWRGFAVAVAAYVQ